jgi:Ser-tRNA(Ala) deacylase AlaX
VFAKLLPYEEAAAIMKDGVPHYIPMGEPFRVVTLNDEDRGCPCGGTHVYHISDIGEVEVKKINKKGANTQVSYGVKE